jgi:hypothetical protein
MKLIYSLHIGKNKSRNGLFCGFRNSEELLNSLLLSATVSGKHFSSCELYCDSEAVKLIEEDGRLFPFTKINICFDELNDWLMPHNWGYSKVLAYSLQKEPFVHLDFDAILWDGIPPDLTKMKFIFQQKEMITGMFDKFYTPLFTLAKSLDLLPEEIKYYAPYALNAGIFGCFSTVHLSIIKKYFDMINRYVLKQQALSGKHLINWDQSIMFEQLFLTNIILDSGLKEKEDFDTFISDDFKNKFTPQYRFSHFIAEWKRKEGVSIQIRKMLQMMGLERKNKTIAIL